MSLIATTSSSSLSLTADIDSDYNCSTQTSNITTRFLADDVAVEVNLWSLLLLAFPIATVFGNALVCVSVWTERSLQTVTNYFIVSLAIADLMVAVLVMPLAVYVEVSLLAHCISHFAESVRYVSTETTPLRLIKLSAHHLYMYI